MNKVLIIGAASAGILLVILLIAISDYLSDYQDQVSEEAALNTTRVHLQKAEFELKDLSLFRFPISLNHFEI